MKNKNGLPLNVIYCKECNLSNQQPLPTNEYFHTKSIIQETIRFDNDNICAACNYNKLKWNQTINWEDREKELIELCNKHRKTDGSYDCIIGGSGGKDSVYQSHILKYKYNMNPLTVTWSPHLYTDIGWKNFQNWIHIGGFDNYLYTPNGKIHRLLTKEATRNLLHPFQPFILGQKTFVVKMASQFNVPLIFYGEAPAEYGDNVEWNENKFNLDDKPTGYQLDPLEGKNFKDAYLGGKKVQEYLDDGINYSELQSYKPLDPEMIRKKNIEFYFLGYYLRWVPQECYYFAVENTNFSANPERTEGTYSKYNSIDDKLDGYFYYTRYMKFGVGRAMCDSTQEIRNGHIDKKEGLALIEKFDGEYPTKYESEFLEYISMSKDEFIETCDKFRPEHIWQKKSNRWEMIMSPSKYFKK
tara:strand:- start:26 stop:1264 length:1239 start_codon:yes stop_codon:yes gene_type:complete